MKFLLKILFVFSTLFAKQIGFAQSNANWFVNEKLFHFDYDDNISYNINKSTTTLHNRFTNFTLSDTKGNLLFYYTDSLRNIDLSIIKNSEDIIARGRYTLNYDYIPISHISAYNSHFVKITDKKYYFIYNTQNFLISTPTISYSVIEKKTNNEWEVTNKNIQIKKGDGSGFLNINRNPDGGYGMVARLADYIYYYKITNGVFELKDSLFVNTFYSGYPDSLTNKIKYGYTYLQSPSVVLNSFGNTGYFYDLAEFYPKNDSCYSDFYTKIYRFDINKTTDKFIALRLLDSNHVYFSNSNKIYDFPSFNSLSNITLIPNDSLLILPIYAFQDTNCSYKFDKQEYSFVLYDIYNNKKSKMETYKTFAMPKILPSGNLICFDVKKEYYGSFSNFYYRIFTPENLKNKTVNVSVDSFYFPTNLKFNYYGVNIGRYPFYISHHLFDYLRFEPEITYTCTASVKLKNLSNKSNGINDFRFYVCKDSACNQMDSFKTFEPIVTFPKNGKYPYKVYGYSPSQTGYGEWYEDTIVVNIPPRPSADFVSSDSMVCRYKELEFTNKSFTKDTSKLVGTNSHWYFANEKDSVIFGDNQDVKYAFTQTGIKEVKLIFSNGFCTDTFSQNIEVIDAPTPGFSVNNLIGCTPFELIINDTHTRFVKQKEYYNSFKNSWDTIPLNQPTFSYQFPTAGNYYLIQKLVGANGCVIVRDTAKIIIRPGITNQDSSQIYYASYLNNQNIELLWNNTEAAKNYQIFSGKDGLSFQNLAEVNDTFYTHHIKIPQVIYYQVFAIDSCGTASKIRNFAKPIYLQTSLFGQNEKAIINYTPYEKLSQNIPNYNLYVLDTLGNTQQVFLSNSSTYNDEQITDYDLSKICYQITFPHPTILKEIKSNIDCINILPTIFIPNSFTPNNDGKNDEFYPSILGIDSYDLYIYNRWGQMVGEYNKDKNWNGKDAPEGVYIYYIRAKTSTGKIINGKGNISLLR